MRLLSMHYFPVEWPFLLLLFLVFSVVVALVELNILRSAYEKMGIPPRYILLILFLTLLGSSINIPILQLPGERVLSGQVVNAFGMHYVVPTVRQWPATIIAINIGGALIPIVLSIYLAMKNRIMALGVGAIAVVALVTHQLARPVRGVGIGLPIFIPPIVAALVALLLSWRRAAPLAYIGGSIGTLVGADLLNLDKVRGLGAPVASIGGAGTFDGVFLVGIVAVLLSSVVQHRAHSDIAGAPS